MEGIITLVLLRVKLPHLEEPGVSHQLAIVEFEPFFRYGRIVISNCRPQVHGCSRLPCGPCERGCLLDARESRLTLLVRFVGLAQRVHLFPTCEECLGGLPWSLTYSVGYLGRGCWRKVVPSPPRTQCGSGATRGRVPKEAIVLLRSGHVDDELRHRKIVAEERELAQYFISPISWPIDVYWNVRTH